MDRQIVYPGSIPLDTDVLSIQRNIMIAIGYLAQATLGSAPIVDGLNCSPTSPSSLTISIGPGSITLASVIDAVPFGSLTVDSIDPLMKMGLNIAATTFTLTAPSTSGQSINYLIQANLLESDTGPVVLPYYNAANPSQPFSGAGNSGSSQNTQRVQQVQLELKPGAPANAGGQTTPAIDSGWVGLYVITVNYGQSQIDQPAITSLPTAPFIPFKLGNLTPGFSRIAAYGASTNLIVPNGVHRVRVRLSGGGGGGGGGASNQGGGGGGAGGYSEGVFSVIPGQSVIITVGAGGEGGLPGAASAGAGGASGFGALITASGGQGGASAALYSPGGSPGSGAGGALNLGGGFGSDGNSGSLIFPGNGGSSAFGGGGRAAASGSNPEQNALAYGAGGGGCYGVSGSGGIGAQGIVLVEY